MAYSSIGSIWYNHLGGDDFDQRIMNYLIEEFKKETGIDLSNDKLADQRLKELLKKLKLNCLA